MAESGEERDELDALAEEFLDRRRRGERPAVGDYLARCSERAGEFRELLSALILVEDLKPQSDATSVPIGPHAGPRGGRSFDRLGDYRIFREVGRGGMGVVYEAEQESLGRRVALKVLAPWTTPAPEQVRRFRREARSAARLQHPNIVPIFGVGEHDGLHFYAMQFISGLGLDSVLDEVRYLEGHPSSEVGRDGARGQVSGDSTSTELARSLLTGRFSTTPLLPRPGDAAPPEPARAEAAATAFPLPGYSGSSSASDPDSRYADAVARIGVSVAQALQYAHEHGMLHRDIKPSNLLLDGQGTVWVTDFGLAKAASDDDLTHTGDIVGTLRYMAPERFRGRCDARSDVYSLGLTLYEMLALRPAFAVRDRHRLIHEITQGEPPVLRRIVPTIPRDLETIVQTAIAKDPAERYATAGELADDLQRWLRHEPIHARPSSFGERLVKWTRRNPTLAALVGVSALALVSILLILSVGFVQVARSLERERRVSYYQRVALAERAWSGNDVGRAEDLLDGTPEGLRGWEWSYLKRLCNAELLTLEAQAPLEPGAVAFSPDAKVLATAGPRGTIALWDAASGQSLRSLDGRQGGVHSLAFSPDDERLASAGADGTVQVWEVASGRPLWAEPPRHSRSALSVAFSPDGTIIASCAGAFWETVERDVGDGELTLWDAATGQLVRTLRGHRGPVHQVAFDPGGGRLASAGSDGTVKIWDVATGEQLLNLEGHTDVVMGVMYRPDGGRLASASLDGTLRVWDTVTGASVVTVREGDDRFLAVAFSPDGQRIAAAARSWAVTLWDAASGQRLETYRGHDREVIGVAFDPGGGRLASVGFDGLVRVWDATRGPEARSLRGFAGAVTAVAFSPDAQTLATAEENGPARLWDCASGRETVSLDVLAGPHSVVAFSPDGEWLAAGCRTSGLVEVWEAATGRRVLMRKLSASKVTALAFGPDGRTLAAGGDDGALMVWDLAGGNDEARSLDFDTCPVTSLAFHPDGRLLAASCGEQSRIGEPGTVTVRDLETGQVVQVLRGHRGGISDLAYSPDGRLLATASWDRTVGVWDTATGELVRSHAIRGLLVWAVAFTPDGRRLAAADNIGRVTLWDAESGHEVLTFRGHTDRVYDLAFGADGRWLASAGRDRVVKLWDAGR